MHSIGRFTTAWVIALATITALPASTLATDVDGSNDCSGTTLDWGDAPEGVQAYPGVIGAFPTCSAAGPVGTTNVACPPISTAPGPAGFVRHSIIPGDPRFWLGCYVGAAGQGGVDGETDGKVNDNGMPTSICDPTVSVDCFETAFGLTFGQDECYGSNDAGLAHPVNFQPCTPSTITIHTANCGPAARQVYLNILVDWNQDGDWNDNFQCGTQCAYEWCVKNAQVYIPPGCDSIISPVFLAGPLTGNGWMRVTVDENPVNDDFPWAGSATMPLSDLFNGETEDYPITIGGTVGSNCPGFEDWGDAPEGAQAYSSGVAGNFPTCAAPGPPGTAQLDCPSLSTPPGPTGYVRHVTGSGDPKFWFGCGDPAAGTIGVDSEADGKQNSTGAPISLCSPALGVDCVEPAFGLNFGQDECIGDLDFDAGIRTPVSFKTCSRESVSFYAFSCEQVERLQVYLNVLVDMNEDGDWNDNFRCTSIPGAPCAYEWAVKNAVVSLPPGCTAMTTPSFLVGPNAGEGWMRMTLTLQPVGDDFPWNGSAGPLGNGFFAGGETEDYPVTIVGTDTCLVAYTDFGDAPEDLPAYATGLPGHFPTCLSPGTPGTQEIGCGTPRSVPPGPTGYVKHTSLASDPDHFWLGCGQGLPLLAVDSEADGKVNVGAPFGGRSACDTTVATDCMDFLTGLSVNQDECYGDLDAGITSPLAFRACSTGVVPFDAYNCGSHDVAAYLNILVDWNHDGDWNDNVSVLCSDQICAYEWAVQNVSISLTPGCASYKSPVLATGPSTGPAWMRLTLSKEPAPPDFPWNGSAALPGGTFTDGETEDYVVNLLARTSGVGELPSVSALWLAPPVPNPARNGVTIHFGLPRAATVSLATFDLAGRRVAQLERGRLEAGSHTASWDFRDDNARSLPSGHYIVKLRVGDAVITRQVIRIR